MPVTNWQETVIDGKNYLVIDIAKLRIPLDWDPSSKVFIAVAAPTGGTFDYPALVKGDDGDTPDLDTAINFTALEWDDPTAPFASWTETAPDVYKLNLGLRNGEPGADGDTVLNPDDFDGVLPGKVIVVNPAGDGFELQTQKVGDRYYPAAYNNMPSGQPTYTLAPLSIGPLDFPWRPECHGGGIVVGTATDVRYDLYARLNGETGGNIVGRALGQTGVNPAPHVLHPRLPAGASDTYDYVNAGDIATIHFRAERIAGTGTGTMSSTDMDFWVKANPVP